MPAQQETPEPTTCRRGSGASWRTSAEALVDDGHALAATDAHRLEAELAVTRGQPVEQGRRDAGAGGPERVAEGDGPTVDVELVEVHAQLVRRGQHLRGERLVDLVEVHVPDGHAGPGQRLARGLDGAEAHDLGREAGDAGRHDAGEGGEPQLGSFGV